MPPYKVVNDHQNTIILLSAQTFTATATTPFFPTSLVTFIVPVINGVYKTRARKWCLVDFHIIHSATTEKKADASLLPFLSSEKGGSKLRVVK